MKLRKSVLIVTLVAVLAVAFASFAAPTRVSAKAKACENSIVDVALAVNAQTGEFLTSLSPLSLLPTWCASLTSAALFP